MELLFFYFSWMKECSKGLRRDIGTLMQSSSVEIEITKKTHDRINVLGLPSFSREGSPHFGLLACAYARALQQNNTFCFHNLHKIACISMGDSELGRY